LGNDIQGIPKTNSEKALQEAALTKAGHLYYEEGKLREAVAHYSRVPITSRYADEVLLGMAWCYIKGNEFDQAMQYSDQLISNCPKSVLLPEAYLIKGYCMTLKTDYGSAKGMFQQCIELCKKPTMSEPQIKQREQEFQQFTMQFSAKEKDIMVNSLTRPNEKVMSDRVQMRDQYNQYEETLKERLHFRTEAQKVLLFARSRDKILKDAEYALATAIHLEQSQKKDEIMQKQKQEEQELEKDIDQLQRELEMLEGNQ
jgi:tetratricopeptide (TPR) repeat protein